MWSLCFGSENVVTVLQAFHTQWGKSENGEWLMCNEWYRGDVLGTELLITESLTRCR